MEIAGEVYEEIRREGLNTELVFMVYYNLVYSWERMVCGSRG